MTHIPAWPLATLPALIRQRGEGTRTFSGAEPFRNVTRDPFVSPEPDAWAARGEEKMAGKESRRGARSASSCRPTGGGGARSLAPGLPASAPRPLREASPGRSPSSRSPGAQGQCRFQPRMRALLAGGPCAQNVGLHSRGVGPASESARHCDGLLTTRLLQAAQLRGQALKEGDRLPRLVHSSQLRGRKGTGLPWLSGAGHRGPTDGPRPQRPRWFSAAGPHGASRDRRETHRLEDGCVHLGV